MVLSLLCVLLFSPPPTLRRLADRAVVTVGNQVIVVQPLADRSIHVVVAPVGSPLPSSFVLQQPSRPVPFRVTEDASNVTVETSRMSAVVDRVTGGLRFEDSRGRTFLHEKPGARFFNPVTIGGKACFSIGDQFLSPPDEHLDGLGQFQDGIWDWRGVPLELRQLNTQVSVPVLVSSKGYGLLWDNASRTDFNRPDTQIDLSAAPASAAVSIHQGRFVPPVSGSYAFCTRDGDLRNEISIFANGKPLNSLLNTWTPRGISAKADLRAGEPLNLTVRGGGPAVKLFVRKIDDTTSFQSDYGAGIDYTVFYGPAFDDVVAGYRAATGAAPLWPRWAYGFWQCRERYSSESQILDTVEQFREKRIPVDLLVQDWLYWGNHGWGSYEWDTAAYPDPFQMISELHRNNVKFMISVWSNPSGITRKDLDDHNAEVRGWIDVFGAPGRDIRWKHLNEAFFSLGTDAWWGDATEPGDPGTDILGGMTAMGPADTVTSAYPFFASESISDGQQASGSDKRVVILTRSAFPGAQRFGAATWSGDIAGSWDAFRRQIPAGLNFSLTGIPYWTTDTGGFFRPRDQYASPDYNELLVRWFQWSTFCPILRVHGYQSQTEPWHYLPETSKTLLGFNEFRHRMLPYNYSVAWKVYNDSYTIMRPLGMDFPADSQSWQSSDEYMFGPAILVAPVTNPGATQRDVFLPQTRGGWVDFWTGKNIAGGKTVSADAPISQIPLFVKAGSIIPLGPVVQYADEQPDQPIEIRIYPGADGRFTLYDDQGDGYGYRKNDFSTIDLRWDDSTRTLTIGARKGRYPGMALRRLFRIVLVSGSQGAGAALCMTGKDIEYNGVSTDVSFGK